MLSPDSPLQLPQPPGGHSQQGISGVGVSLPGSITWNFPHHTAQKPRLILRLRKGSWAVASAGRPRKEETFGDGFPFSRGPNKASQCVILPIKPWQYLVSIVQPPILLMGLHLAVGEYPAVPEEKRQLYCTDGTHFYVPVRCHSKLVS